MKQIFISSVLVILIACLCIPAQAVIQPLQAVNCTFTLTTRFQDGIIVNGSQAANIFSPPGISGGNAFASGPIGTSAQSRTAFYSEVTSTHWEFDSDLNQPLALNAIPGLNVRLESSAMDGFYAAFTGNNTVRIMKFNSTGATWFLSYTIVSPIDVGTNSTFGYPLALSNGQLVTQYATFGNSTGGGNATLYTFRLQTDETWTVNGSYANQDIAFPVINGTANWLTKGGLVIYNDTIVFIGIDSSTFYILQNIAGVWTLVQTGTANHAGGMSTALYGNYLAVSSAGNMVKIYFKTINVTGINVWLGNQNISSNGSSAFGYPVALYNNFLATADITGTGAIFTYTLDLNTTLFNLTSILNSTSGGTGLGRALAIGFGDCLIAYNNDQFIDIYCHKPQDFCGICGGDSSSCAGGAATTTTTTTTTTGAATTGLTNGQVLGISIGIPGAVIVVVIIAIVVGVVASRGPAILAASGRKRSARTGKYEKGVF